MEKPLNWGKKIISSISPRKKTPESSPRVPEPITHNAPKKELSPQLPIAIHQDCVALSHLATEIDILYRSSKEMIERERVEHAYVKALRCFVQTYEQNPQETKIHLQKLLVLFLELHHEKRNDPRALIPEEYVLICNQARHVLYQLLNERK